MTAVGSFMSSGVLSFKKSKADIIVHNSAQDTYNQLMDSIMQANDIVLYAYTVNTTPDPSGAPVTSTIDFTVSGETTDAKLNPGPTYYVRDMEQWNEFATTTDCKDKSAKPVLYSDIPNGTVLYVVEIITDVSVPVDLTYATVDVDGKYKNNITGEVVEINKQAHRKKDTDPSTGQPIYVSTGDVTDVSGNYVYDTYDTQRNIFSFEEECMYYQTRYAFMTALDDVYDSSVANDSMYNYVYSESFSYAETDAGEMVTGCMVTVDVTDGAISLDLKFNDKNMTYTTQGMVKFRNSYVLRAKN